MTLTVRIPKNTTARKPHIYKENNIFLPSKKHPRKAPQNPPTRAGQRAESKPAKQGEQKGQQTNVAHRTFKIANPTRQLPLPDPRTTRE